MSRHIETIFRSSSGYISNARITETCDERISGTAFFLKIEEDKLVLVTARHVVETENTDWYFNDEKINVDDENVNPWKLHKSNQLDLAYRYISAEDIPEGIEPLLPGEGISFGQKVVFYGFSSDSNDDVEGIKINGEIASACDYVIEGGLKSGYQILIDAQDGRINSAILKGISGGAVVDTQLGRVLGVFIKSHETEEQSGLFGHFQLIKHLELFDNINNIDFCPAYAESRWSPVNNRLINILQSCLSSCHESVLKYAYLSIVGQYENVEFCLHCRSELLVRHIVHKLLRGNEPTVQLIQFLESINTVLCSNEIVEWVESTKPNLQGTYESDPINCLQISENPFVLQLVFEYGQSIKARAWLRLPSMVPKQVIIKEFPNDQNGYCEISTKSGKQSELFELCQQFIKLAYEETQMWFNCLDQTPIIHVFLPHQFFHWNFEQCELTDLSNDCPSDDPLAIRELEYPFIVDHCICFLRSNLYLNPKNTQYIPERKRLWEKVNQPEFPLTRIPQKITLSDWINLNIRTLEADQLFLPIVLNFSDSAELQEQFYFNIVSRLVNIAVWPRNGVKKTEIDYHMFDRLIASNPRSDWPSHFIDFRRVKCDPAVCFFYDDPNDPVPMPPEFPV